MYHYHTENLRNSRKGLMNCCGYQIYDKSAIFKDPNKIKFKKEITAFHFLRKCYMIKLTTGPGFPILYISVKINLGKLRQFSAMGRGKKL